MARAAFQLAMSSARITADVVEVQEFPDVARQYQVRGVPMTVVNDVQTLVGNVGGGQLLAAVLQSGGHPGVPEPTNESGDDGDADG